MDGIIIIDKPVGPTSHDICQKVKRMLGCKKVGHTGTLDPIASGVLPLLIDGATKWAERFASDDKEYLVAAQFGVTTTTYDLEGEKVAECAVPADLMCHIGRVLPRFRGRLLQVPPPYSAIKHQGKPLYWWARRGRQVEVPPREVDVRHFALIVREHEASLCSEVPMFRGSEVQKLTSEHRNIEHRNNKLAFRITCSKGTYVRSLVHDLGQAVGCGAHVTGLRRVRSGRFTIDKAVPPDAANLKILYKGENHVLA